MLWVKIGVFKIFGGFLRSGLHFFSITTTLFKFKITIATTFSFFDSPFFLWSHAFSWSSRFLNLALFVHFFIIFCWTIFLDIRPSLYQKSLKSSRQHFLKSKSNSRQPINLKIKKNQPLFIKITVTLPLSRAQDQAHTPLPTPKLSNPSIIKNIYILY